MAVDFPTGVSDTTPTFLAGGNANTATPSKAACGTLGLSILASASAVTSLPVQSATGKDTLTIGGNSHASAFVMTVVPGTLSASTQVTIPYVAATDTLVTAGAGNTLTGANTFTSTSGVTLNPASGTATYNIRVNGVAYSYAGGNSTNAFLVYDSANSTTVLEYTAGAIGACYWTFPGTLDASSSTAAGLVASGGVAIAKSLQVGQNVTVGAVLYVDSSIVVQPTTNNAAIYANAPTSHTSYLYFMNNGVNVGGIGGNPLNPFFVQDIANSYTCLTYTAGAVGAAYFTFAGTLSASSSTAGAVVVGNGTATTSVAIGGGNINVGGAGAFGGSVTCTGPGITLNPASGNATLTLSCVSGSTDFIYCKVNSANVAIIGMNAASPFYLTDPQNSWNPWAYTAGAVGAGYVTFAGTLSASSATVASVVMSGGLGCAGIYSSANITVGNNTNGVGQLYVTNNSSGTAALAMISTGNGTTGLNLGTVGASYSSTGIRQAGYNVLYCNGAYAISIGNNNQPSITILATGAVQLSDSINTGWNWCAYTPGTVGAGYVTFAGTLASTSSSTGAVVVTGGVGVGGNSYFGGTLTVTGQANFNGGSAFNEHTLASSGSGYQVLVTDSVLNVTGNTAQTMTMVAGAAGLSITIKNNMSTASITLNQYSTQTIAGSTSLTITAGSSVELVYDNGNTNWVNVTNGSLFTYAWTAGAGLVGLASGTSTATTNTSALSNSITYSGVFTTGPNSSISGTATFSGATATSSVILTAGYFSTSATGAITNSSAVTGSYNLLTAAPTGAATTTYSGESHIASVTSAANVYFAGSTLIGAYTSSTFNTANTSGAAVAAAVYGDYITTSVATTNASGTNTIATVAGIYWSPGTMSSTGGGGLTITNYYGLYLGSTTFTTMTATNKYGVYQADTAVSNVFAGSAMSVGLTTVTANSFSHLGTAGLTTISAATQDGVKLLGRAGGSSSYFVTITPGVLTSNITLTSPLVGGTICTSAGASNQVAVFGGTNAIASAATFTATTTTGALIVAIPSGTSTATTTTAAFSNSVTYSGAFTTGPNSSVSGSATYSGNTATASVVLGCGYFTTSATGTLTSTPYVSSIYGATTVNPGGASTAQYNGLQVSNTVTSSASNYLGASTLQGVSNSVTFNSAATAGATILAALTGESIAVSSVVTNTSGSNTITNTYGVNLAWGTFSAASGGTITYTNLYGFNGGIFATSGSGTVSIGTFYGANLGGVTLNAAAGSAITTYYACYLATPTLTAGTITNRYGLYQSDASATNYFAGLISQPFGTSTATSAASIFSNTATFSGIFTSGVATGLSISTTFSGATATGTVTLTGSYFNTSATGAITNANAVTASYNNLTVAPTGTATAVYSGESHIATVTGAANVYFAGSSLLGSYINSTFNTANTSGATVAANVIGEKITVAVGSTNASGTNTVTSVYGIQIAPGTWAASGGGGLTVTNYYGLYIGTVSLSTTTITNRYGIYQTDTAARNIFAGAFGFAPGLGSGSTVTQITSRTTGVTLNYITGQITLFSAAGSTTPASFTVTNSTVAATDTIIISQASGSNQYFAFVTAVAAGSFQITFYAAVGTATDSPVFNFTVLKGAAN